MENVFRINVGVYSVINIDLTEVPITDGEKVVLTVKNFPDVNATPVITREFFESTAHQVVITPEESISLVDGAVYDFCLVTTADEWYKIRENEPVYLVHGVGDCIE